MGFLKNNSKILLFVIILAQVMCMIYWGDKKSGYYHDEYFTFESAHYISHSTPNRVKINDLDTWKYGEWFYAEELKDTLAVQREESLWNDPISYQIKMFFGHRPYMSLLNYFEAVIFPGEMNKWSGIIINIVIFILNQITMYLLVYRLTSRKLDAFLALLLYGFSGVAISMVIFVRFYTWATFLMLFFTYMHVLLLEEEKIWKTTLLEALVSLVVFLAYKDSPLVILYAAPFICMFLLVALIDKNKNVSIPYLFFLIGMVFYICIKTDYVYALFNKESYVRNSDESNVAAASLINQWIDMNSFNIFCNRLSELEEKICNFLFGDRIVLIIYIIVLLVGMLKNYKRDRDKTKDDKKRRFSFIMVFSVLIYLFASICFGLTLHLRYISHVFPVIAIVMAMWTGNILYMMRTKRELLLVLFVIWGGSNYITQATPRIENVYFYVNREIEELQKYNSPNTVLIDYNNDVKVMYDCITNTDDRANCLFVKYDEIKTYNWGKNFLLWQAKDESDAVIKELMAEGYENINKIADTNYSSVYLCQKNKGIQ